MNNSMSYILGSLRRRTAGLLPGVFGMAGKPATGLYTQQQGVTGTATQETFDRQVLSAQGYGGLVDDFEVLPGTYHTYRLMDADPTLAMAKAVAVAPVLVGSWSFEAREGTPDAWVKFIKDMFEPLRDRFLDDALMALSMGWAPFEVVWDVDNSPADPSLPACRYVVKRLKALHPDDTYVQLDPYSSRFLGVSQGAIYLPPEKCLVYANDQRGDNYYGRSRHENCRFDFCARLKLKRQALALGDKVSGVIPIVRTIKGGSKDSAGRTISNFEIGKLLLKALAKAKGVVFESLAADADEIRNNPDLLKLSSFDIDTIDTGSSAQGIAPLTDREKYFDSLFFRAWLHPERQALEANGGGTNAEAVTHLDVGMLDSEKIHRSVTNDGINRVINKVLEINFGAQARGAVMAKAAPLVDSKKVVLRQIFGAILNNPATLELLLSQMDQDQLYDQLEVPILQTVAGAPPTATPPATTGTLPINPPPPAAAAAISNTFAQ